MPPFCARNAAPLSPLDRPDRLLSLARHAVRRHFPVLAGALIALWAGLCLGGALHAQTVTSSATDYQQGTPSGVVVTNKSGVPYDSSTPLPVSATATTQGYGVGLSTTRPNDTTAYTANDVVGGALTFASAGPSAGGQIMLTSAELEIDASAIISGETSYNLYLYSVTPPSALADNAAFDIPSGDRASFLGKVLLGTPVDEGSTLYVRTDAINAQFTAASGTVYGYLVTVGGYTPTAQRVYKVTLHFAAL